MVELHKIISPTALSYLIPVWETQWRVVFYTVLEVLRTTRKIGYSTGTPLSFDKFVRETLRLHAPVKRIHRKLGWWSMSFDIMNRMKSTAMWGAYAHIFDENRPYSPEQAEEGMHNTTAIHSACLLHIYSINYLF